MHARFALVASITLMLGTSCAPPMQTAKMVGEAAFKGAVSVPMMLVGIDVPQFWRNRELDARVGHLPDGEHTVRWRRTKRVWGRGKIKDGKLDGEWTLCNPRGTPQMVSTFEANVPNGLTTYYHWNGSRKSRGMMKDGDRVGEWEHWDIK